jgi:hypothetical protein
MSKFLSLLFCLFVGPISLASVLTPLPLNPTDLVSDANKQTLTCAEIPAALEAYNTLARANEAALADFILEVTNLMYTWFEILSPFETNAGPIEAGTFAPIQEGAVQMEEVVGLVYENSDQLAARMQIIMTSLENCL